MNSFNDITDLPKPVQRCPKCGSTNVNQYVNMTFHIAEEKCNDCGWKQNRYF